jgi:hypothetical protein
VDEEVLKYCNCDTATFKKKIKMLAYWIGETFNVKHELVAIPCNSNESKLETPIKINQILKCLN